MDKPASLRRHLTAANPDLKQNPDKLLMFADQGNVAAVGTASLSFEYHYNFNIIITDYSGDTNAIIIPLLAWVAIHQIELISNPDRRKNGINFEIDYNNHNTIDISINLKLTERIIVKQSDNGKLTITQPPEPQATPNYDDRFWTLYQDVNLLAEWATPNE